MQKSLTKLLDLLFENSCLICNGSSKKNMVCDSCEKSFVSREHNYFKTFEQIRVYSWGYYEGKIREGIIQLKNGNKKLAGYFCKILVNFWHNIPDLTRQKDCLVIPVPSHKQRIKERGYCQTTIIARELSKNLGFNFTDNFVRRIKETSYMTGLNNIKERIENIKNAFEVTGENPDKKNILIIDDILTSGNTMCELAKTIHRKYPKINLIGLTIASGDTYS